MQPAQIDDNIIINILYLDVVLTETSGQNLDFLENIILILKEKIQNGFSDDENWYLSISYTDTQVKYSP